MNRETKYRAYCPETKRIFQVDSMTWEDGKVVSVEGYDSNGEACTIWEGDPMELMEYIGHQDCNGKEIYEGDILDLEHLGYWIGRGFVYRNKRGGDFVHSFQEAFDGKLEDSHRPSKKFWISRDTTVEIIGNVYQNPELLEQPHAD